MAELKSALKQPQLKEMRWILEEGADRLVRQWEQGGYEDAVEECACRKSSTEGHESEGQQPLK